MKNIIISLSLYLFICTAAAGELWAPKSGYSSVDQSKTYNNFNFTTIEGRYTGNESYEHETQVYNDSFADYDGYWSSNLPGKYYDTPFLDNIDNFTIGSARASEIKNNLRYYTYMALRKGNNSDCRGCCSSHGGVICSNGLSQCSDGTPLSETCTAKACNQCLNTATVRIKGQLGESVVPGCSSTWCIFATATTQSMCTLKAPQYKSWSY